MKIMVVGDTHLSSKSPVSRIDNYGDTSLSKISQLVEIVREEEIDLIIQTGDIFHIKDVSYSYLGMMLSELDRLRKATKMKKIFAIVGNHDMLYRKPESINKTVSGIVFRTGIFTLLEREVISGWEFVGISEGKSLIKASVGSSIMVGHAFLDNKLVPNESFSSEELMDKGYKFVILGHDHIPYTPTYYKGNPMVVIRPGALMRGTIHNYNMYRKVGVNILNTDYKIEHDENDHDVEVEDIRTVELVIEPAEAVLRNIKRDIVQVKNEMEQVLVNLFESGSGLGHMINYVKDVYNRIRKELEGDKDLIGYLDLKFQERGLL